jgi:hypothetical protein
VSSFVRGATVIFNVTFLDEAGANTYAQNTFITVAYRKERAIVRETLDLDQIGNTYVYTASWNSSNAEPGEIQWHARGDGEFGRIAIENEFTLIGNRANPGDD